jgi:hypothetical protein
MASMSLLSVKFTKIRDGYETAYEEIIGAVVITPVSIGQLKGIPALRFVQEVKPMKDYGRETTVDLSQGKLRLSVRSLGVCMRGHV